MQIITGFDAFDGGTVNPSEHLAETVAARTSSTFVAVPTRYAASFATLHNAIEDQHQPVTSILLLGRAAGEKGLRLERLGRVGVTSPKADNDGLTLSGPIVNDGPLTLTSVVPLDAVQQAIAQAAPGVATSISDDAGGFVCNYLYYRTLHAYPTIPTLFVHLDGADELLSGEPAAGAASLAELTAGLVAVAQAMASRARVR